jgi:hypothetical protein
VSASTAELSMTAIEQVLVKGDLAALNVEQRVQYFNLVCKSLGLNPLTRPLQFMALNGKVVLYATRDCTDQLRKLQGVSILSMDSKMVGDLLVVTTSAKDRAERTDFATGVVNTKGLVGADLANAMMKAETKSKRRVTLSLCGLGLLDESEVEPDELPPQPGTVVRENGAAALPASHATTAQPKSNMKVYIQVQKHFTVITGNTYFMKDHSKSLGAEFDGKARIWKMPAGRTHQLLALCDKLTLEYQELDDNGQAILEIEPQVPIS